jgi:putative ABC transport system permease protein
MPQARAFTREQQLVVSGMATVPELPLNRLALCFLPAAFVVFRMYRITGQARTSLLALARMTLQLSVVGYVLVFVFQLTSPWPVLAMLGFMAFVASWIAVRPIEHTGPQHRKAMLLALLLGPGSLLLLLTQFVLPQKPWYEPSFVVPLAGMILANSMNALSVAAERYEREVSTNFDHEIAAQRALRAGMIGITNSLLAVGLVSFPGMMTGQILAGISPVLASRYQIMVMCVLFSASGIAISVYLSQRPGTSLKVHT